MKNYIKLKFIVLWSVFSIPFNSFCEVHLPKYELLVVEDGKDGLTIEICSGSWSRILKNYKIERFKKNDKFEIKFGEKVEINNYSHTLEIVLGKNATEGIQVTRHLNNIPLEKDPPTVSYRIWKVGEVFQYGEKKTTKFSGKN